MSRIIKASEFKAKCLGMLEEVRKTRKPLRITRFGKPVAEVARELGIYSGNIYRWASELTKDGAEVGSGGLGAVGAEPVADELSALRRENARLRMDNDILKKAAVILASYPPGNAGR